MQEIYVEDVRKVLQNKRKLEDSLNIIISNKGKNIFVDGNAEDEFIAIEVLEAINVGFSIPKALLLKEEEMMLQRIHIKDLTKRKDLKEVRARIIGTKGKTLGTINNLTNCEISLQDNEVGIIGDAENIEDAIQGLQSIIQGSKQGNVYSRIERERKKKRHLPMDF